MRKNDNMSERNERLPNVLHLQFGLRIEWLYPIDAARRLGALVSLSLPVVFDIQ